MPVRGKILLVVKMAANLAILADVLLRQGYEVERVSTLEALDCYLEQGGDAAFALVDISGFDSTIWVKCSSLAKRHTPFFVISPRESSVLRREVLSSGASGIMVKPLGIRSLLEAIGIFSNNKQLPSSNLD